MTRYFFTAIPTLLLTLMPQGVHAQPSPENTFAAPPIQTDRPSFSAGTALVPQHSFQFELGFKRTSNPDESKLELGQLLLRYGLSPNIELRLAPNSFIINEQEGADTRGIEDTKLSVKIVLVKEAKGPRPAMTLLPGVSFDTGHSDITSGESLPSLTLLLDWPLGNSLSLTSNLGWERAHSNEEAFDKFSGSLVLGFPLAGRLSGYAEVYGFDRETPGGGSTSFFDLGLIYLLERTLSIDATAGSGLSGTETDSFFGVGLNKRW